MTLRGLSRSLNVLRTCFVTGVARTDLAGALSRMMNDSEEEEMLREQVIGIMANLLLEFSPLRDVSLRFVELLNGSDVRCFPTRICWPWDAWKSSSRLQISWVVDLIWDRASC